MFEKVLEFWYRSSKYSEFRPEWFSRELDQFIKQIFGDLHNKIQNGEYTEWKKSKYGKLAYIIVLDQFTRNLYRDGDFRKNDHLVLELVEDMLKNREDLQYEFMCERMFILLPLRHSKSSSNIRKVLTILEEYKCNIDNMDVLDKFKLATIRDLTKADGEYIYTKPNKDVLIVDNFKDVLDLDYGIREKLNDNIDLESVVSKYINKYSIERVGISLSGGIDSMVLLDITIKLLGKNNVVAVYVSHSNRDVAEKELQFLINWCSFKDVLLVYRKVDYMNRENIDREFYEEETKNLRFELYKKVITDYKLDGMCLGHHKDDIGENVMMNILQNRDVIELKGMTDRKEMYGVIIFRPMLAVKKDVIWAYGNKNEISCFIDSTPDWSWRGLLRKQIYPKLDKRVGSIHTILADLGEKSEEWNTVIEKMVFGPIFKKIEYFDNGCILYLDKISIEMQSGFYSKLLVHMFHSMHVNMISHKNLIHFLEWLKNNKDSYCSLSNEYMAVKECDINDNIIVYFLKNNIIDKDVWTYKIITNDTVMPLQKQLACSYRDILKGIYSFNVYGDVETVKIFRKSDNVRRLYKGFDFLPRVTSINSGNKSKTTRIIITLI
jgi:tRNA(Ile)-lysidine synthetase-like protein